MKEMHKKRERMKDETEKKDRRKKEEIVKERKNEGCENKKGKE
jgi:hypothetical protein